MNTTNINLNIIDLYLYMPMALMSKILFRGYNRKTKGRKFRGREEGD